jgi:hypothetical protein
MIRRQSTKTEEVKTGSYDIGVGVQFKRPLGYAYVGENIFILESGGL